MSDNTLVGWTDATWPIVAGCEHLSPGCDRCWSARLTSGRLRHQPAYAGLAVDGKFTGQVRILPERLSWPLHWRKPRRVFVCSASDLFHKGVPTEFIAEAFAVMALSPRHTFQVLTKRAGRMRSVLNSSRFRELVINAVDRRDRTASATLMVSAWPLPNVHLGVSVEDQHWADVRIPALLDTTAAVRWLSVEPLLGPVELPEFVIAGSADCPCEHGHECLPNVDWVVVGGESGPGHRPMDVGWLTSVVDQCRTGGIPMYVKQDSGPRAGQQGRIPDEYWIHDQARAVTG